MENGSLPAGDGGAFPEELLSSTGGGVGLKMLSKDFSSVFGGGGGGGGAGLNGSKELGG